MDGQRQRRWLLWVPVLLLSAGLLHPETRELQALLLRLLLHPQDSRTIVAGQPAGCVVRIVPNVEFTPAAREAVVSKAAGSPDAYLLARVLDRFLRTAPAAQWQDYPFLEWAATDIVLQSTNPLSYTPGKESAALSPELFAQVSQIILQARLAHPENGALAIAQAVLEFEQENPAGGLEALSQAAAMPEWRISNLPIHRAHELLEREGLPRFDAALGAYTIFAYPNLGGLAHRAANHLDRLVAAAVRANDDTRLREIVSLWARLRQHHRFSIPFNASWFPAIVDMTDELRDAAAEHFGIRRTDWKNWEDQWKGQQELVRCLLAARIDPAVLAVALEREPLSDDPALEAARQQFCARRGAWLNTALKSSMLAVLALVLLALAISLLLMEFPILLFGRHAAIECFHRAGFWALLAAVTGGCTFLVYKAIDSFSHPVGLQSGPVSNLLVENIAGSIALALCIVSIRLVSINKPLYARIIQIALTLGYVIALTWTAMLRHLAVEQLSWSTFI